jgi:uncharacterized protein (UPF0261 family)
MYDPDADRGFLAGLQKGLRDAGAEAVLTEEFDLHINDDAFAEILAKRMELMIAESAL